MRHESGGADSVAELNAALLGVQYWSMFSISRAYEYDACTTESTLVVLPWNLLWKKKWMMVTRSQLHPGMMRARIWKKT